MSVPRRRGLTALVLVLLFLGTGIGLPESSPGGCADGCDDDGGGCADCPLCSPARAAVLVPPDDCPVAELVDSTRPFPSSASRTEDRGVTRPKPLA
jgi:hypothetical protein